MYLCGSSTRRVSNDDIASASVIPSLFACSAIASAVSCLSNSSDGTVVGLPQSRYSGSRSERKRVVILARVPGYPRRLLLKIQI